ncbi:hypothetical protein ACHAPO_002309 [Fusarium lateritium]
MGAFTSKPQKPDQVGGKRKRSVDDHTDCPPAKRTRPAHIPDDQHIIADIPEQLQKLRSDAKLTGGKLHEIIKCFDKHVDVDNEGRIADADHGFWLKIALSSVKADLFLMADQIDDVVEQFCSTVAELMTSGELTCH